MPLHLELTIQEKARIKDMVREFDGIARQIKSLRGNIYDALQRYDNNRTILPSDRTGSAYILDDEPNIAQRVELTRIVDAIEDLYGMLNGGTGFDGTAWTRQSTGDAQLTDWINEYYDRNIA